MEIIIHLPDQSEPRPEHSPLGASGAERWMNCVGSVALIQALAVQIKELGIPAEDDPDYRAEGIAMHEASEDCLKTGKDTWEIVGESYGRETKVEIDGPMADAIQVYLSVCREIMRDAPWFRIEHRVSSPIHPQMFGTADFAALIGPVVPKIMSELDGSLGHRLKVLDLKGGEGILVYPDETPQLPYYAFCVIDQWERETGTKFHPDLPVDLGICQPRAYHDDGEPTHWHTTTVGQIKEWVFTTLLPAMEATALDNDLEAGKWCRFCPAKLICPLLVNLGRAAATFDPQEIVTFSDENLAREYQLTAALKFYVKAVNEQIEHRLRKGRRFEGVAKMVPKKSNRVWKSGAEKEAKEKFGDKAVEPGKLKSPAELEKLSPEAKLFTKEHSYMPFTGETVAAWDDKRPEIKLKSPAETFKASIAALAAE